jgi:rRNA-processing protein EBP2
MVTKSKLKMALAAEKGVDFAKLKQQKKAKEAAKRKAHKASDKKPESEDGDALDETHEATADDQEKVGIALHF